MIPAEKVNKKIFLNYFSFIKKKVFWLNSEEELTERLIA